MTKLTLISITSVLIPLCVFSANSSMPNSIPTAERFFPDDIQQDGKITLSPSFTPDGNRIYFSQSECSPIWECPQRLKTSTYNGKRWTKPVFVRLPTNDRVDWPFVTPDGTGERDIYLARATQSGEYAIAHPLPAPINSKDRDDGVWVNPEGNLMLLSYSNRGGKGSADIFISNKVDGIWQSPINVGDTVNTGYAEFGARLSPDGKKLIFTSDRPFEGQSEGLLQAWIVDFPLH